MRSVSMQIRKQDQDVSLIWLDGEIIKRPFFHIKFPSQKVKLSTPITLANCISLCLPAHSCCCFKRGKKGCNKLQHFLPYLSYKMDKYFLILFYFSLQPSKILAAKTSLLTRLAIPSLVLFFYWFFSYFSAYILTGAQTVLPECFVLQFGHLKYLRAIFFKYLFPCCLAGSVPRY